MQDIFDRVASSIFQVHSLDDCDPADIRNITEKYPYFAPGRLLLARKVWNAQGIIYIPELQTGLLYGKDPFFLHGQLTQGKEEGLTSATVSEEVTIADSSYGSSTIPLEALPAVDQQPALEETEIVIDQSTVINKEEEATESTDTNDVTAEAIAQTGFTTIEPEQLPETDLAPPLQETEIVLDQTAKEEKPIPGIKFEPIDPQKAELAFTPYYTIDYFASQGIKLKDEEKPVAKFDQQLKSFTDWIKVMRKLPAGEVIKSTANQAAESKVEKMAIHSLAGQHADTEAMAEVWEKQGRFQEALTIYEKLKLQNPAKSGYFAAKIDELKKQL